MTSPTLAADQALDEFRAAVKAREAFGPVDVFASAALGASFRDTRPSARSALAALSPVKPGSRPVAGAA
jgi:hypothetical protein